MPDQMLDFARFTGAILIVAVAAGVPIWLLNRNSRPKPIDETRNQPTPKWSGVEVVAVFAIYFLSGIIAATLATEIGQPRDMRRLIWASLAVFPIFLALTFALLRTAAGVTVGDVGLRTTQLRFDITAGYRTWLIWTPIVVLVHLIISVIWSQVAGKPEAHPSAQYWQSASGSEVWGLWLSVSLVAPVQEEIMCRGLLLPVVMLSLYSARVAMCFGVLWTGVITSQIDRWESYAAVTFVIGLLVYHVWRFKDETDERQGIVATAAVFAAMHANIWPSPVALFVLGYALGRVAWQTRSIVPAILAHSLFNTVTGTYLTLGGKP